MQAMAAAYLGKHDRSSARAVLVRTLQISSGLGLGLGLLLAVFSQQVVGLFTKDAAVAALASAIMPVITLCMPLDAAASITDGGLIAAGQTNALSVIQVLGTLVQYAVMVVLLKLGMDSVVYVWAVLKVMTLARLGGGLYIHFGSPRSAFRPKPSVAQAAGRHAAAQPEEVPAGDQAGPMQAAGGDAGPAATPAVSGGSSATGRQSSSSSSQPSSASNTQGVFAGAPLQQPPPQQPQPPFDAQQVQVVPPQQHLVVMQHQQQPGRRQLPPIGGRADVGT